MFPAESIGIGPSPTRFALQGEQLHELSRLLAGRRVLITGGTGTLGQALVERIVSSFKPASVVVFSRDELKQSEMAQHQTFRDHTGLLYRLGDVRDPERLEHAFRSVDFVIHAAALKQIAIAEHNPEECLLTNTGGVSNVVRAAGRCGVKRVLLISTDKAVQPTSVYGASKLAAERIVLSAQAERASDGPIFSIVRYGNVIGSRGSLVERLRSLRATGGTVSITDERMTRFWITPAEAADFVLSCLVLTQGGEVWVPRLPSSRVFDLVRSLVPELPTRTVGRSPGEKLHECLLSSDESAYARGWPDRFVVYPPGSATLGEPLPQDFCYRSDENEQRLSPTELAELYTG